MKGGSKVVIEPHRHEGVFIARGKEDALVTLNSTPGVAVYGEKRISVESPPGPDGNAVKVEYRVWNPFRSKSEFVFLFFLDLRYVFIILESISHVLIFCEHYLLMINEKKTIKLLPQSWEVLTTYGSNLVPRYYTSGLLPEHPSHTSLILLVPRGMSTPLNSHTVPDVIY